jgi:anti-sigma B factor antagonist
MLKEFFESLFKIKFPNLKKRQEISMSKLKIETVGDVTIVELEGQLDVQQSPEVLHSVSELINSGVVKMIFNLENLQRISSSGIRVFIEAMRNLKDKNGNLKIANMTDSVRRIFKVVEIIDTFEIYNSLDEAIESFNE